MDGDLECDLGLIRYDLDLDCDLGSCTAYCPAGGLAGMFPTARNIEGFRPSLYVMIALRGEATMRRTRWRLGL